MLPFSAFSTSTGGLEPGSGCWHSVIVGFAGVLLLLLVVLDHLTQAYIIWEEET